MNKTIAQQLNITKFPFNIKDDKGNEIYYETSYGFWTKSQYDEKDNDVYYEDSKGYWAKKQYDEKNNKVYCEDSTGFWYKKQFDEKGNKVYYEDSYGYIVDTHSKQTVEITLDEIAKKFNIDVKQIRIKD